MFRLFLKPLYRSTAHSDGTRWPRVCSRLLSLRGTFVEDPALKVCLSVNRQFVLHLYKIYALVQNIFQRIQNFVCAPLRFIRT